MELRIRKQKIYFSATLILLLFFILSFSVLAQTKPADSNIYFQPQVSIPGTKIQQGTNFAIEGKSIGVYIIEAYKWSISAVAILAVVMIMVAGFKMVTSRGNASAITSAKSQISSALVGLVIIIFAYFFLNFINPNLVIFKDLTITHVTREPLLIKKLCYDYEFEVFGGTENAMNQCSDKCDKLGCGPMRPMGSDIIGGKEIHGTQRWCCQCKGCIAGSIKKPPKFSDCSGYCLSLNRTSGSTGDPNCCLCENISLSCEQINKDDAGKYNCDSGSVKLPDGTFDDGCGKNLVCNNKIPGDKTSSCVCQLRSL